jgi:predicted nucleic acid-binding protein
VIVVSDAGPLMAFAKTAGPGALFSLFPSIVTPPAVYEEVVTAGLRLDAPDALLLRERYQSGALKVQIPAGSSLPLQFPLGRGEEESILLAIEHRAIWFLADDLDARRAAFANFEAAGVETRVKGTLGIILSAFQEGGISREAATRIVIALSRRPDIWIQGTGCQAFISGREISRTLTALMRQ